MNHRCSGSSTALACLVILAGTAGTALGAGTGPEGRAGASVSAQVENTFLKSHPGTAFYRSEDRITTVYGRAFQGGATAADTADAFILEHAALFGVTAEELVPGTLAKFDGSSKGLMWQPESQSFKFTLVSRLQQRGGIPVFQSDLRLLVRNEPGNPLVLARSALRNLGAFVVDDNLAATPNVAGAFEQAMREYPGIGDFSTPRVVIFAGDADHAAPARLALEFEGAVAHVGEDGYEKWHLVADAGTGAIVWSESMISHVDVSGNIKGMATAGYKADICASESLVNLPYARASIGSTVAFADANGDFTIPNSGSSSVTVVSGIRGRWFRVYNSASGGADPDSLSMSVSPPGPANFSHNPSNNNATKLSGVNAYIGANRVRDYALTYDASFPTIWNQQEWRVNINVSGTCNAYYDGSSINFYASGGGCPSTAFGSVVYHEYGHHMVNVSGSGQGQYGEGYGDLNGVMMDDDPILGYGFTNNCSNGIRTAANSKTYPCSGEIHDCGQLLTGCFWSTRNKLVLTNPSDYRQLLSSWAVNSVQLHTGTEITPSITVDVLTLDDDDSDITNGTPHYQQIQDGFSAHNMGGPVIDALSFSFPDGKPTILDPEGGTTITVVVTPNLSNTLNTSSGKLYIDPESDGSFVSYSMVYQGSNTFVGTFPAIPCDTPVRYYVEAKTGSGSALRNPLSAPAVFNTAFTALDVVSTWSDNAETANGWVASKTGNTHPYGQGDWGRGVPVSSPHAPTTDADGSGKCWLTGNYTGYIDDPMPGVQFYLTSPAINGLIGDAVFSYARWFYSSANQENDTFTVQVSNNNGASWVTMDVATDGADGWSTRIHRLADYVPLTSQMRVRFIVEDVGSDTLVEAAVDDFSLGYVQCTCFADFNHDGFVSGEDFDEFVALFESGDSSADVNGDGFVTGEDFDAYSEAFVAGC